MKGTKKSILGFTAAALLVVGCDHHSTEVSYIDRAPIPSGVYSITGDGEVEVFWSPILGAGVLGYGVWRADGEGQHYRFIAEIEGASNSYYRDTDVANGHTYFYVVDSFTHDETSEASEIAAIDTPRPQGIGILFDEAVDPARSGLDFADVNDGMFGSRDDIIAHRDAPETSYFVFELDGLLRLLPTAVIDGGDTLDNDIQDFGFTDHLDDIDFAPAEGWSWDPAGVELIEGHTYILWTWNDYYAKLRVTRLEQSYIEFEWAYQTSDDDIERFQLKAAENKRKRKWNHDESAVWKGLEPRISGEASFGQRQLPGS